MKRMNAIPDGGVNCMDECKVCGHKNPISEANFCFYCGASFRENADMITSEAREANSVSDTGAVIDRSTEKKPFSTLRWLGGNLLRVNVCVKIINSHIYSSFCKVFQRNRLACACAQELPILASIKPSAIVFAAPKAIGSPYTSSSSSRQ